MIAGELICVIRLNKKEKDELDDGRGIAEWIVRRKLEGGINFFFSFNNDRSSIIMQYTIL